MGGWNQDQQLMLKSFLEDRFTLANIVKQTKEDIKTSHRQIQALSAENQRLSSSLREK